MIRLSQSKKMYNTVVQAGAYFPAFESSLQTFFTNSKITWKRLILILNY